jgi:hypothetical protein
MERSDPANVGVVLGHLRESWKGISRAELETLVVKSEIERLLRDQRLLEDQIQTEIRETESLRRIIDDPLPEAVLLLEKHVLEEEEIERNLGRDSSRLSEISTWLPQLEGERRELQRELEGINAATVRQRRAITTLSVAAIAILVICAATVPVAGFLAYRTWQSLRAYPPYRSAVAAIQAREWDTAAEAIIQLNEIDPAYRDIPNLVAAQPELRNALANLYGELWLKGNVVPARTFSIDRIVFYDRLMLFSSNARAFLLSDQTSTEVSLWDTSTWQQVRILTTPGYYGIDASNIVALSPDGKASSLAGDRMRLWDTTTGKQVGTINLRRDATDINIRAVIFSADGKLLAVGSSDQTVSLWDVSSARELRSLKGHTGAVRRVFFSPNGKIIASVGDDKTVRLWDVTSGRTLSTFSYTSVVDSIAFHIDGKTLAFADYDVLKLWDLSTGKERTTLKPCPRDVSDLDFSPDGKVLAVGCSQEIKLWDVSSSREVPTLNRVDHGIDNIRMLIFSPDGRLLASASDFKVIVWTVRQ